MNVLILILKAQVDCVRLICQTILGIFQSGFGFIPSVKFLISCPAVYADGLLWVTLGSIGAMVTDLGQESSFKYWDPNTLYFFKFGLGAVFGGAMALKTFRSTSYGKHLETEAAKGDK